MTSGRKIGFSKIDKNNLREPIMSMKRLGLSYTDIINQVKNNYNIVLNKSNLTMFFARPENQINLMEDNKQEGLSNLHMNLKEHLLHIRKNLQSDLELLTISIDETNLKPIERGNLKKTLKVYEKRLLNELDSADNHILNVVETLNQNTKLLNQFLMDMSNELCPKCSRVVSYYADKILKGQDT